MSFNHKLHTFGHRKMTRGYTELSLNRGDTEGALAHPEFGVSVKRKKKIYTFFEQSITNCPLRFENLTTGLLYSCEINFIILELLEDIFIFL